MVSKKLDCSSLDMLYSSELDMFIKKVLSGDKLSCGLLDLTPIGISFTTDLSCEKIRHNTKAAEFFRTGAWCSLSSHAKSELMPIKVLYNNQEIFPPEMPLHRAACFGEKVCHMEIELLWEDGVRKFGLLSARPLTNPYNEIIGAISVCEDITKQKLLEAELAAEKAKQQKTQQALTDAYKHLQECNHRFHAFMDAIPLKAWIMDEQGHYLYLNKEWYNSFGAESKDLLGKTIYDLEPPYYADRLRKNSTKAIQTGKPIEAIEETVEIGGKRRFWKSIKFPFHNRLGEPLIGCIAADITNQKQMEKDLHELNMGLESKITERTRMYQEINIQLSDEIQKRKIAQEKLINSEARYKGLFEQMPLGLAYLHVIVDEEGNFVDNEYLEVNREYEKDYGENLIGKQMKAVFPNINNEFLRKLANVGLTGQPISEEPLTLQNKYFMIRAYSLEKEYFIVISRNITKQKTYEEELARLDRLNLVGEIAAGIGHEIRNPITTVRGYLQMFLKREKFSDYQQQFTTMIEEIDMANAIITEFLSLAKNKRVELKARNLNDTIIILLPFLQADAFRSGHKIRTELADLPLSYYDDKEIRQLILNLVRNGLEAMNPGGTLTVKTSYKDKIILAIQDNGPGIPEEVLRKLGTPFLTTKENGTGLGLSVCYRIAERHNAKIDVKTSSKGTTFFVQFMAISPTAETDSHQENRQC